MFHQKKLPKSLSIVSADKKKKPLKLLKLKGLFNYKCCPTRIRTWTDRTKIWSAAITPLNKLFLILSIN